MIKEIRIGPLAYTVREVDTGREICGDCDFMNCRIRINKTLHPDMKQVTLWHEIIHAILFTAGMGDHDEQVVDSIAHGMLQVLKDNPQLRNL